MRPQSLLTLLAVLLTGTAPAQESLEELEVTLRVVENAADLEGGAARTTGTDDRVEIVGDDEDPAADDDAGDEQAPNPLEAVFADIEDDFEYDDVDEDNLEEDLDNEDDFEQEEEVDDNTIDPDSD